VESSSGRFSVASSHQAISGVVRLLAEVRLAVLALALVLLMDNTYAVFWVAVTATFSYVPARSWEKYGQKITRSGVLLACDLAATVLVVLLVPAPLGGVYGLATASLVGVVAGWRLALPVMAPVALLLLPLGHVGDIQGWVMGAAVAGTMAAMTFTGSNLGEAMRHQWLAAEASARREAVGAATAERVRIARDMHDTVAGDLAGTILLAQVLADTLVAEGASTRARGTAEQIVGLCTTAHSHTRAAISELRRADVHPVVELGDLCAQWSARTSVACSLDVAPEVDSLDPIVFADVKAILAELLENVRRHAGAFSTTVDVTVVDGEVVLAVGDDGRGLRGADRKRLAAEGHFGLTGVDERAAGRGGSVTRTESAGGGLLTVVRIPVVACEEVTV
jgi:signal transduction histidine kinase